MGIKEEFHQKTILNCVNELLYTKTEDGEHLHDVSPCDELGAHNMLQQSFSSLEKCTKCNKYLRGLLHQGVSCQGKPDKSPLFTLNFARNTQKIQTRY